jgi:hypothetical protein
MKTRAILLSVAAMLAAVTLCYAADSPFLGTWKLNDAKSKIGMGGGKNSTVVYEMAGDSIKVTVDGVDADGKPTHSEWTGKLDGKYYPVTGNPGEDTRAYRMAGPNTLTFTVKKGDKVTETGRIVISADGKSRTVTTTETNAKGMKVMSKSVFDKQ